MLHLRNKMNIYGESSDDPNEIIQPNTFKSEGLTDWKLNEIPEKESINSSLSSDEKEELKGITCFKRNIISNSSSFL